MDATPTLLTVLVSVMGVISTIIGAMIAAMKVLWNKAEKCAADHAECEKKTAKLEQQNKDQELRMNEHHNTIERLKDEASTAKELACSTATTTEKLVEKMDTLQDTVSRGDSKNTKPGEL